ncbi:MAG: acyltransferase [Akkermansia sp.]|nr:acyltransferase [Akkermansia sp.]
MGQRLYYPDICKFLAIFFVTCAHSAQAISGQIWTQFLGGRSLDIAFEMPLFMLMSGWFINIDAIREGSFLHFFKKKFYRLIVPMLCWYGIFCAIAGKVPGLAVITFYWYLSALFVCLMIIALFAKIIRNNLAVILISMIVVLLCPYSDCDKVNFMFPFIWAGYGLRRVVESRHAMKFTVCCCIASVVMGVFWNHTYTVYCAPFDLFNMDAERFMVCLYRFAIGCSMSMVIIYLAKRFEQHEVMQRMASLGRYSLPIYTCSSVLNYLLGKFLANFLWQTNEYVLLDIMSIIACCGIIAVTIWLCNLSKKNRKISLLIMGE